MLCNIEDVRECTACLRHRNEHRIEPPAAAAAGCFSVDVYVPYRQFTPTQPQSYICLEYRAFFDARTNDRRIYDERDTRALRRQRWRSLLINSNSPRVDSVCSGYYEQCDNMAIWCARKYHVRYFIPAPFLARHRARERASVAALVH